MGVPTTPVITRYIKEFLLLLTDAHKEAEMGIAYSGDRKERGQASKYMILTDSAESQIIADAMESGFGLRLTKELINKHRC